MALPPLIRTPFRKHPPDTDLAFANWLDTELGQALLDAQRSVLDEVLPGIPGQRAVQVGMGEQASLLRRCVMARRWYLGRRERAGTDAVALPAALPLAKRSLDLVLLHHSLDFEDHPHRVLSEAVSALQPGGAVVVVGFNPISLWGFSRLLRLASARMPWAARFIRPLRLNDWLALLNCEVEGFESGFFAPPVAAGKRRRLRWLERLGTRFWPQRGGFYVLVARKRAVLVTPLETRPGAREPAPNVMALPMAQRHRWRRRSTEEDGCST